MATIFAVDARTADPRFPGIGRYTQNLLASMIDHLQEDERVLVLCNDRQRVALALPRDRRLEWAETDASPFGLSQQWRIPALLKRRRVDVYHSPYYLMPYWTGAKTVLTVYDVIPQRFPAYVSLQARLLFRFTTQLALRRAAHVIAISQATRADYLDAFNVAPQQITAIPLAAAPQFKPRTAAQVASLRHKYDLQRNYVLYVGSNKPHKNVAGLLRAWGLLEPDLRADYDLVLAGRWDNRYQVSVGETARPATGASIRTLVDIDDEDLPALYSGTELFVFPSFYEGFGLPVLEAMACGCAVACANGSSLPEVVAEAALRFDPRHPEQIAEAIALLLRDPVQRQAFQRLALGRAASFSWQRTALETLQCYRMVADSEGVTFRDAARGL